MGGRCWRRQLHFRGIPLFYKISIKYTPPHQDLYVNSSNTENATAVSPTGGPLQVSFSNSGSPLSTWIQLALEFIGMRQISGFNGGSLIGSAFVAQTINPVNAHRSSSESSFLAPSIESGIANHVIYKNSLARRMLFSGSKVATGVPVTTEGTYDTPSLIHTLLASKGVILSAGAFRTPQLLMVSRESPASMVSDFSGVSRPRSPRSWPKLVGSPTVRHC